MVITWLEDRDGDVFVNVNGLVFTGSWEDDGTTYRLTTIDYNYWLEWDSKTEAKDAVIDCVLVAS